MLKIMGILVRIGPRSKVVKLATRTLKHRKDVAKFPRTFAHSTAAGNMVCIAI